MAYFSPYIDETGLHMPTYDDRLEDLVSAYRSIFGIDAELSEAVCRYDAFTDVEFNPEKSINCQARSAAIFVSLRKTGALEDALRDPETFKTVVYGRKPFPEARQLELGI